MFIKELNNEIYIDEEIHGERSPAIYFLTHLYCQESLSLPKNWNQLRNCYIYTTEVENF